MIKDLQHIQAQAKHGIFAQRLSASLKGMGVSPSPAVVAQAFNRYLQNSIVKPHTVRKWLIGQTKPRSETLLSLAQWLKIDPVWLISDKEPVTFRIGSAEFGYSDQEAIAKYLAMPLEDKVTVRKVIDAIADKNT